MPVILWCGDDGVVEALNNELLVGNDDVVDDDIEDGGLKAARLKIKCNNAVIIISILFT